MLHMSAIHCFTIKTYMLHIVYIYYSINKNQGPNAKCGLDSGKLLTMHFNTVYTYSGKHLTHLVRIPGIACAFEPRFARYGTL